MKRNKLLIVLGPTATGKTDLAIKLAKNFNGELVSCDSRQVYVGLDIGTGKLPSNLTADLKIRKDKKFWEIDGIKIWMYDVVSFKKQYTVADYMKDADKVIVDIISRGKLPIIIGGTGYYLKGLLQGLPSLSVPTDQSLRKDLEKLSLLELQLKLQKLSIDRWNSLNSSDQKNPRRIIRSIEILSMYGFIKTNKYNKSQKNKYNTLKIGLTAPREVLYKKAGLRVLTRLDQGMIEEVNDLLTKGLTLKRMRSLGLEYRVLADYLNGQIKTKEELINVLKGKIHGYLRRQLTWFKKETDIFWFDISQRQYNKEIEKRVLQWYDSANESPS